MLEADDIKGNVQLIGGDKELSIIFKLPTYRIIVPNFSPCLLLTYEYYECWHYY